MDIGLIKMSKIGKKIIISYLIIILSTSMIFMGISKVSFNNILNRQTKEDLKRDADMIINQISMAIDGQVGEALKSNKEPVQGQIVIKEEQGGITVEISEVVLPRARWYSANRLATTHLLILDQERNIVFQSYSSDDEPIDPLNIDRSRYFLEERGIKSSFTGDESLGYLVMVAKKEDLSIINSLINRSAMFGFVVASFIALILAFFFERGMINPVNVLRKNISSFSLDKDIAWSPIRTKDEISDINNDFLNMAYKLKDYYSKQREFFQNTSHELKTPLMSIQGYAEAIRDGIIEPEDVGESLDIIIDESKKLRDTVNSIVYISKIDKRINDEEIKNINLWELSEEQRLRLAMVASGKNIEIINEVDKELVIPYSDEKLDVIFSNILSNSMRYASEKIIIKGYVDVLENIVIVFEDDGRGFSSGEEKLVFDRFYKGKNGVTGLGLSIVKTIIDSSGWFVEAYNNIYGGASIEITIPSSYFKKIKNS